MSATVYTGWARDLPAWFWQRSRGYLLALALTLLAVFATLCTRSVAGGRLVMIPFFPAVIAVAVYAGVRPAIFSAVASVLVMLLAWHGPHTDAHWLRPSDTWALVMFALATALSIGIAARLRQSDQRTAALLLLERDAREEAERVGRVKDEFLATLSHELRNPLSAIVGWAQVLHTQPLPTQVVRGLEIIERNARAQTRIIDDLLDMSRIIAGTTRLEVRPVDLQKVVDAAIAPLHPAASAKKITIERVSNTVVAVANCDPDRLNQVLWNLLSNAVKFTHEGGRIEVRVEPLFSHAEIRISDTGVGLDPAFLPFVFDRFRPADPSLARRHRGLGLGLSICKHLVELHGGTIRASSEGPGKGAAFTIRLPLSAQGWDADAVGQAVTDA